MTTSLAWLGLVVAALLLAGPTLATVRRAGPRRVPLLRAGDVRPPWWTVGSLFPAMVLLGYGSHELSGDGPTWSLYFLGTGAVSFALQFVVVSRHNRHLPASAEQ